MPSEPEKPLHIDGVPTIAGLAKMGRHLAYARPDGRWQVTDAGHALMGKKLSDNAIDRLMRGEGDWVQPPSSLHLKVSPS